MRRVCFKSIIWAHLRGLALGATTGVACDITQGIWGIGVRVTGWVQLVILREVGTGAVGAPTPKLS